MQCSAVQYSTVQYSSVQYSTVCVQVVLACELGKPLFLHERDAHQQMVDILERFAER